MGTINGYLTSDEIKSRDRAQDNSRIYLAEVMDTRSPTKNGDIKVWILGSNTNKENPKNWIVARCCMGLYGNTIISTNQNTGFNNQVTSYGEWTPVPYVGNYVFIFFPCVVGQNTLAYWFGSPNNSSNSNIRKSSSNKSMEHPATATFITPIFIFSEKTSPVTEPSSV